MAESVLQSAKRASSVHNILTVSTIRRMLFCIAPRKRKSKLLGFLSIVCAIKSIRANSNDTCPTLKQTLERGGRLQMKRQYRKKCTYFHRIAIYGGQQQKLRPHWIAFASVALVERGGEMELSLCRAALIHSPSIRSVSLLLCRTMWPSNVRMFVRLILTIRIAYILYNTYGADLTGIRWFEH